MTGTTSESHLDTETESCDNTKVHQTKLKRQKSKKSKNEPLKTAVSNREPIARLIGKKATTKCLLNGLTVTALVDTGAQVSLIDRAWKNKYIPDVNVRPIAELIELTDYGKVPKIYTVNGEKILLMLTHCPVCPLTLTCMRVSALKSYHLRWSKQPGVGLEQLEKVMLHGLLP